MWKREEAEDRATQRPEATTEQERRGGAVAGRGERATIGRSITIRGEVTGDEDLVIQGRVEGSVDLKQHAVTVGPEGVVKADISGRVVTVEGNVEGNLRADEQVVLRASARVQGDLSAPRVILEDGAYFRGGVDMGEGAGAARGRSAQQARALGPKATEYGGATASTEQGTGAVQSTG
jgi:cytoskeletal protein CcmA (bactofilin family)